MSPPTGAPFTTAEPIAFLLGSAAVSLCDADHVDNPKKMAAQLGPILGEPQNAVEKKLAGARHFVWIKRCLTDQQAQAVENLKGSGLNLANEYKRFYPYRQVGGQVVGFVGLDGAGLEGIENHLTMCYAAIPLRSDN